MPTLTDKEKYLVQIIYFNENRNFWTSQDISAVSQMHSSSDCPLLMGLMHISLESNWWGTDSGKSNDEFSNGLTFYYF